MIVDPHRLIALLAIVPLAAATPGVDMFFVLSQTRAGHPLPGLIAVGGIFIGLLIYVAAVALGLGTLFAAWPVLYTIVRIGGAIYLAWLAWNFLQAALHPPAATSTPTEAAPLTSPIATLRRGALINLTNPKSALFFTAFLPAFTDPALGNLRLQLLVLGFCSILIGCGVYLVLTLAVCFSTGRLPAIKPSWRRAQNIILCVLFAALAVELLVVDLHQ